MIIDINRNKDFVDNIIDFFTDAFNLLELDTNTLNAF